MVAVLHGPDANSKSRAIAIIPGCNGFTTELIETMTKINTWPEHWKEFRKCIIIAIQEAGGRIPGQGYILPCWRTTLPDYFQTISDWLVENNIIFILVGYSRGAQWALEYADKYSKNLRGMLFIAGYDRDQTKACQLKAARHLLKPDVGYLFIRSTFDEYSNSNKFLIIRIH